MFYDLFSDLCKKNGVTPNKACIDCEISRTSVAKWRKGATPNGTTLSKLADYFGVTTDYLLGSKKAPTQAGGRSVSDDEIKFALWGTREIDDDVLEQVKAFAKFARENRKDP